MLLLKTTRPVVTQYLLGVKQVASHLDISGDSGPGSLIRGPPQQQGDLPPSTSAGQEQFRQPQVQENFCPGPESTFMPVESAKEPTPDVESIEDDQNEITEESFIQNALNWLDQRGMQLSWKFCRGGWMSYRGTT